jgi:antitoxin HicB
MISYRVNLEDDQGTVLVTPPDFPELVTFGDDADDALSYAVGAFGEAIAARMAYREEIPLPSKGKTSDPRVTLPMQAAVKVLLYQQMRKDGVRKAHKAFTALGKTLDIAVSDAQ